jgi:uncharacterized protein YueI
MKKVTQPSDTGFVVSNKSVEAPVSAVLAEEPAVEKVSKRASKKAEATVKEEEAPVAVEEVAAEPEVAKEEPAAEAE